MSNNLGQSNPSNSSEPSELHRCSAYCTASYYQLKALLTTLQDKNAQPTHFRSGNVVHRVFGSDQGDVFYFSYGTVVMWRLTKSEEQQILSELRSFEEAPVDQSEFEESRYVLGKIAKISKDDITLPSDNVVTKLAFSHGLAQSVKLAVFEKMIERRIESTRYAPESLAKKGRIPLSRKQLTKMMGELFLERNSINLHTDILDTPEFFWENSDLEPLYRLIAQDLDISARVTVLNKRLDIVKELFEMLSNELENRHSSSLEWIIIGLIFFEIMIVVAKEILHLI
jgi:uncharacterized Rmd1/YagE family protein